MKFVSTLVLALGVAIVALSNTSRADDKEVTLKGQLVCAKCELKETPKCANAIRVKEEGKDVVYYFKDMGGKESYHKACCQAPADGSVKGTVTEMDGKKYITPAKDGVKVEASK
jgi:hypothetical protein